MVTKMASDLETCNADLKACTAAFRTASPAFVADSDSSGSALAIHSASASPTPLTTSAPLQDADPSFQSGITELSYTRDPPVSSNDDLFILFDADDGDVDRLSRLPDSLLRNIITRLPIKDVGRTAVLFRRWSHLWHATPLVVDHADLAVLRLEPRSLDGLLEQIRWQQQGHARSLLANHDPSAYTAARALQPSWLRASRSTPSRRCCSPSWESALVPTPVLALEFLIRPYDPGAGFVGIYFNTEEAEHARVDAFAMDLLRRNGRTWPADLRTGVGTTRHFTTMTAVGRQLCQPHRLHRGSCDHADQVFDVGSLQGRPCSSACEQARRPHMVRAVPLGTRHQLALSIIFDTDGGGIDHLPDSLLCDFVNRLPTAAKADVCAYEMALLELTSRQKNRDTMAYGADDCYISLWAVAKVREGRFLLLYERLAVARDVDMACNVACWCLQQGEALRPTLGQVVQELLLINR